MAWAETDTGTYAGSGTTIRCEQGPLLTPSAGAITVTDSFHSINGGTLSTINGGVPNSLYVFSAPSTVTLANLTNIRSSSRNIPTGNLLMTWFDGSTFTAINGEAQLNVRSFGAVGDGITDDTAAIKAAITAAVVLGIHVLYFPAGNYLVTEQLLLGNQVSTLANKSLIFGGFGQGATKITSTVTGAATWDILNPDADVSFAWRDMTLIGPGGVYSPGANVGFLIQHAINLRIANCELSNWADSAIESNGGYGCHFDDNYIHDIGNEGVLINGGTGKGNHVEGNTLINIGNYAIDTNDRGTVIRGNTCYNIGTTGSTSAITVEGDFGQNPIDIVVADNVIVAGLLAAGINISCDGAAGSNVKHVSVSGNIIDGGGNCGYGVYITPQTLLSTISDIAVTGNVISGVNSPAVYAAAGATRINVTGNTLDSATYAVQFDNTVTNSVIGPNTTTAAVPYSAPSKFIQSIDRGSPTFAAGDFTGSGVMTWTVDSGDVTTFYYSVEADMMTVVFTISNTTVGGTPSNLLQIKVPLGHTALTYAYNQIMYSDNGGALTGGYAEIVGPGGSDIRISKLSGASWSAATNATGVFGQIKFQIA